MTLLRLDSVALRPAGRTLFQDLCWSIADGRRIGLVGPNGAGKSSLLRLLAGRLDPDAGTLVRRRELRTGHLSQDPELPPDASVAEAALRRPPALARLEAALARVEERLGDPAVYRDDRALARTLARQEQLLVERAARGGDRFESRVRSTLEQLGLDRERQALPCRALSGGQKKLVALAALAAAAPELLLLDEPDNHLDLASKERLERFLAAHAGSVVIVSHDRYLLDSVVDEIAALEDGRLRLYPGSYSHYTTQREIERLRQEKRLSDQQKEVARIEAAIARFEHWARLVVNERHIRQARSRRKQLERMQASDDWVERPAATRSLGLVLEGGRGSRQALEIEDLALGFGEELLLAGAELRVRHGERVGLVGPNGCGKSSLLRAILGQLPPLEGSIRLGPSTRVGYYAQEHETLADWRERTPLELVRDRAPMYEEQAVSLLLRMLFRYDQLRQPIGVLSGGERSRLQLACLMLERPNLLLLDEPTNHLDIPSAEVLEAELERFEGAVLVVSHDRYLLDRVADRLVAFERGELVTHPGGYTDWVRGDGAPS